jgi:hypothetical protein
MVPLERFHHFLKRRMLCLSPSTSLPHCPLKVQHTQVFERYGRYEPEVAEALTDMFVSGTSTQKVGKVAEKLLGVAPSASAGSRLNQALTEQ